LASIWGFALSVTGTAADFFQGVVGFSRFRIAMRSTLFLARGRTSATRVCCRAGLTGSRIDRREPPNDARISDCAAESSESSTGLAQPPEILRVKGLIASSIACYQAAAADFFQDVLDFQEL